MPRSDQSTSGTENSQTLKSMRSIPSGLSELLQSSPTSTPAQDPVAVTVDLGGITPLQITCAPCGCEVPIRLSCGMTHVPATVRLPRFVKWHSVTCAVVVQPKSVYRPFRGISAVKRASCRAVSATRHPAAIQSGAFTPHFLPA